MKSVGALWIAAALLAGVACWRAVAGPDAYADGAVSGPIEDRRLHRFRNATYTETQHWFETLLERAGRAGDPTTRARALAALASLQRERGMMNQATAAAEQAQRLAPADPEVRRLLSQPIDLRELQLVE